MDYPKCNECGAQLRDNVKFCTKCGARLSQPVNLKPVLAETVRLPETDKKQNQIKGIAAVAAVLLVFCIGVIVYINLMRKPNIENAENNAADIKEALIQKENEIPSVETKEQETVAAENVKTDETQNIPVEVPNEQKAAPEIIQFDTRYISSIQASSELTDSTKTYHAEAVLDGNKETCWCEGVNGTGEGETLRISFTEPVYISEIAFLNGYLKDEKVYNANGKFRRASLEFDEGSYEAAFVNWQYQEIENAMYSDRFPLDEPVRTQSLTIRIQEAWGGEKYDDICLTELALWGYADNVGNADFSGTADEQTFSIYDLYEDVLYETALLYGSDCEYALYDIDNDGVAELITSQGSSDADWTNTVYTIDDSGTPAEVGTFYGAVSLYAAENGNGIYSVYAHMGYQEVEWVTKNGSELYTETILSGETENYYENDNPIPMSGINADY